MTTTYETSQAYGLARREARNSLYSRVTAPLMKFLLEQYRIEALTLDSVLPRLAMNTVILTNLREDDDPKSFIVSFVSGEPGTQMDIIYYPLSGNVRYAKTFSGELAARGRPTPDVGVYMGALLDLVAQVEFETGKRVIT